MQIEKKQKNHKRAKRFDEMVAMKNTSCAWSHAHTKCIFSSNMANHTAAHIIKLFPICTVFSVLNFMCMPLFCNEQQPITCRDCYPWVQCSGCQGACVTQVISQSALNKPTCLCAIWVQEVPVIVMKQNTQFSSGYIPSVVFLDPS
jgi:hypothetical protein